MSLLLLVQGGGGARVRLNRRGFFCYGENTILGNVKTPTFGFPLNTTQYI